MGADLKRPVVLAGDPRAPEADAIAIPYQVTGQGVPLLFLHSGWGYSLYPFDRQIAAFRQGFRILIPHRLAHRRSREPRWLVLNDRRQAAAETIRFLDALGIERSMLWGHSEGAVVAAWMALEAPERFAGVILEAVHFYRCKPLSSAEMLAQLAVDPDQIGERVAGVLAAEHGEDHWRDLIMANSRAWLQTAAASPHPKADLFDGRLPELSVPTLVIHGSQDPRTEPDELDSLRKACPQSRLHVITGCCHSPHTERASFDECNKVAGEFLGQLAENFDHDGQPIGGGLAGR